MSTQTEQQPLTDEEIRAIRKRVEMATPEPWRACTWDPMVHPHVHKDYLDQRTCCGQYDIPLTEEDVIFIAHAREDVPRLLDEIERLRAIEAQAIEQSEYVQREWLSPSEATGLKREVERLRAELDRARGESWGTFEREVNAWQTKTFPRSTLASCLAHLRDELAEIEESPEAAEEYADALLLLMSAYRFCGAGVDLFTAARIKFDIVKQRNWGEPDERGVVKHVGSPPPAQQSQED